MLAVFLALTVLLWRGFLRAGKASTRGVLGSAGVLSVASALVSLAAVMANIQGTVTPFASLFPMLTEDGGDPPFAAALTEARQQLADPAGPGARTSSAIDAMTDEFARYHVVMAVISGFLAVVAVGVAVLLWRRFAATASADRRADGAAGRPAGHPLRGERVRRRRPGTGTGPGSQRRPVTGWPRVSGQPVVVTSSRAGAGAGSPAASRPPRRR
ncbi:hypothetical protein [Frankia sp. AgB32]|uniref:hypothetical protein n=1 Tax=Frankia sp. AgB32 TaxID=631119 RepID=UPI00200DB035|nr:hypothetical protein [Frankia sp. AgB32]MCK9893992.1 hypothetical protein [Frankia sp. AgB32]